MAGDILQIAFTTKMYRTRERFGNNYNPITSLTSKAVRERAYILNYSGNALIAILPRGMYIPIEKGLNDFGEA